MTFRHYEGSRAKILAREFERDHPFGEIYPLRPEGDPLQCYFVSAAARGYEGRFDFQPGIVGPLTNLYQLREQAGAEEWPVAPEPVPDELPIHLHEVGLIAFAILATSWIFVHSIALSISQ